MSRSEVTASSVRAIQRACRLASALQRGTMAPQDLLLALFLEQSRAWRMLDSLGVTLPEIERRLYADEMDDSADNIATAKASAADDVARPLSEAIVRSEPVDNCEDDVRISVLDSGEVSLNRLMSGDSLSAAVVEIIDAAGWAARHDSESEGIGSEHLLYGMTVVETPVQRFLNEWDCDADQMRQSLGWDDQHSLPGIPTDVRLTAGSPAERDHLDVQRLLDATANRLSEGLRVVEDGARFILNDRQLTTVLKQWRHDIRRPLARLLRPRSVVARDSAGDVGTSVSTSSEQTRSDWSAVILASLKRIEEAARSLEEYGKLISSEAAVEVEQLRYRFYDIEKTVQQSLQSRRTLADRRLYLLLTPSRLSRPWQEVLQQAVAGGVSIVQLREKKLADRHLLELARELVEWCRNRHVLCLVNDRPDLAVLADADGVHVGQDELPVHAVRRIVGSDRLIGVSTHELSQARAAVCAGADYLGVGPVFPSPTKSFTEFPGLRYVQEIAAETARPWYAIGGITSANVADVAAAGAERIAVSSSVAEADNPRRSATELLTGLARRAGET